MNKYYYTFPAESKEGKALRSFHRAVIKAEQEQMNYCKKVGAYAMCEDKTVYMGGIVAVMFKDPKSVNTNIWHKVGIHDESYEPIFLPNVVTTIETEKLDADQPIPKSTARKLYANSVRQDKEGNRFVTYFKVEPAEKGGGVPKSDQARAVQAEMWRLKLPIVRAETFYQIVHADRSELDGTDARKVKEHAPRFYRYNDVYYIGLDYPIHHEEFEPITDGTFIFKKNEMIRMEMSKNKKEKADICN